MSYMKYDGALNEVVKVNGSLSKTVKFAKKHMMSRIIQTVTKVG